jgi:RNA polymerase sigma factor (sigma-70 family)
VPDDRERRFRQLYDEHYRPVQAYAIRRVATPADVADVTAEVFTTAWRRLDDIPPPPSDRLWLYGVARRVVARQFRTAKRFRRLISRIEDNFPAVPDHSEFEQNDRLFTALGSLPPGEREALLLVTWEQLPHAEAAQVLGCSANAVGIRVHRARARLREALGTNAASVRSGGM